VKQHTHHLSSDFLITKFAFEINLYRYRADWLSYLRIAKVLSVRDPEMKMRLLSRDTVNYAGDLLRKLKGRVDLVRGIPYPGKGSPSSVGLCTLNSFDP
jgi:hypothetical protein